MADFRSKDDTDQPERTSPHSASAVESGSQPSLPRRRKFLLMAVAGAVGGLVTPVGMEFLSPSSVQGQTILSPKMALKELLRGNKRFVAVRMRSFELDLAILRNHTSELQQPFAAVLACADSRVPVELVFDQSIGQIFVTRVAGNVTTSEIIASLEYGAAYALTVAAEVVRERPITGWLEQLPNGGPDLHLHAPGRSRGP